MEKLSLRFNQTNAENDTLLTILTQDCKICSISLDFNLLLAKQNELTKELNLVQSKIKYEIQSISSEIHSNKLVTPTGQELKGLAKMVGDKYIVLDSSPYIYEL